MDTLSNDRKRAREEEDNDDTVTKSARKREYASDDLESPRNQQLIDRCRRLFGWSMDYALKVCEGYRAFLDFKKALDDWDATILSPSAPVDMMWHQHILDTRNYVQHCVEDYGQVIHHDPDGSVDEVAHQRRVKRTLAMVKLRFGDDWNDSVWYFPPHIGGGESETRTVSPQADRNATSANETESEAGEITVFFKNLLGDLDRFQVNPREPLHKVFVQYARSKENNVDHMRFIHEAHWSIDPGSTAEELGIEDQDVIHVVLKLIGC